MKNILKFCFWVALACATCGCMGYDNFKITEKPFVNHTSVELYIGDGAGNRNSIQLISSPAGNQYTWTSLDPSVATVTQTGFVTAVAEGFAMITVASDNDQTTVNVWVRQWLPLEDFQILGSDRVVTTQYEQFQITTTFVPMNTSETDIQWTSSNPQIISVYENGWVVCNGLGSAVITARAGDIVRRVTVQSIMSERMSRGNWSIPGFNAGSPYGTIGYSSQHTQSNPICLITYIFNDNPSLIWAANWQAAPIASYPHWFIIDLGEEVMLTHVSILNRQDMGDGNNGPTGFELFTCTEANAQDLSAPTSWGWVSQGEYIIEPANLDEQRYALTAYPYARYIRVYMDTKFQGSSPFASMSGFWAFIGVF